MFAEDLSVYFDTTNGFAVPATLAGGAVVGVVFDQAYTGALAGLVESTGPQCIGPTSALGALVQGSVITINGNAYTVTGNQPDGTGVTTLQLRG
jgi:hypothetical protein